MSDLAAYLGAAVLVALAAWAFAMERSGGRRPLRRIGLAFALCEGCSLALLAPGTVAAGAGVDGLTVIVLGDTIRTLALSLLMLLACLIDPRPVRRRSPAVQAVLAVAVQAGMVLLLFAARPRLNSLGQVVTEPGGRWALATRVVLFAGYSVWALVELFLALRPFARAATGPLRWGLRLILTAIWVGVLWTLWSYDDFVGVLRHGLLDGSEDTVSNTLGATCAALVVAGALVGKGSVTFGATARALRRCRCYLLLGPLHAAMREAMPQIAFPQAGRPLLTGRPAGIEFALYRRVIEIHDGRLVLRAHRDPRVALWLRRLAGPEAAEDRALVEAATLAAALEHQRHGRRFAPGGPAVEGIGEAADEAGERTATDLATDLDAEVRWLVRVSSAFRRSPLVPAVLELVRGEEAEAGDDGGAAVPAGSARTPVGSDSEAAAQAPAAEAGTAASEPDPRRAQA